MKLIFIIILIIFSYHICNSQQIIRNYSFEYSDCFYQPIGWRPQITKPNAYLMKLKTDDAKDGRCSVSLFSNPSYNGEKAIGLLNSVILGNLLNGRDSIKIAAFIKTKNVTNGFASIWLQLNGYGRIVRDINYDKLGLSGSTYWTRVEIALPITPDVMSASFGCKLTGNGEALFDSFSVLIDGKKIE